MQLNSQVLLYQTSPLVVQVVDKFLNGMVQLGLLQQIAQEVVEVAAAVEVLLLVH